MDDVVHSHDIPLPIDPSIVAGWLELSWTIEQPNHVHCPPCYVLGVHLHLHILHRSLWTLKATDEILPTRQVQSRMPVSAETSVRAPAPKSRPCTLTPFLTLTRQPVRGICPPAWQMSLSGECSQGGRHGHETRLGFVFMSHWTD